VASTKGIRAEGARVVIRRIHQEDQGPCFATVGRDRNSTRWGNTQLEKKTTRLGPAESAGLFENRQG
jgi:hypothetical protein